MPLLLVLVESHNVTAAAMNLGWLTSKEQVGAIRKASSRNRLAGNLTVAELDGHEALEALDSGEFTNEGLIGSVQIR
jgi:diketogulonate reductase-like aldo/keto reductase